MNYFNLCLRAPLAPSFPRMLIATNVVWRICVADIQLCIVVFCKLTSQAKVAVMPTNIQPLIIENIVQFPGLGLSQSVTGVSKGAI